MIELANSNTSSDVIDIGIYGNYDDGLSEGGVSEYTGLFRDASDSTWKLFDGLEEEPTTTVNIAGTNYAKAALEVGDLDATTIITTDINLENTGGNAVLDIKASNTGLSRVNLGDTDGSTRGGLKYDHSNDSMAFRANGSDQMTLTNTGLGIGTSSPQDALHVKNPTTGVGNTQVILEGVTAGYGTGISFQSELTGGSLKEMARIVADGSASWNTTTTTQDARLRFFTTNDGTESEKMVISHDGNVGIGTTSPTQSLEIVDSDNYKGIHIRGSNAPCLTFAQGTSTTPTWRTGISGYDGTAFAISTGASVGDVVHIESNGDFGIGTTSATSKLHVNSGNYAGYAVDLVQEGSGGGNHGLRVVSSSGSSYTAIFRANASTVFYVDGAGNYYFSGSNQSDVNKKENIADITDSALDLITQLQPKTYNFIGSDIDKAGFIAQDMEQVIPRLVTGNEFDSTLTDEDGNNPTGKGIDYMGYTAYLTKAIQELKEELDAAKARIETLENA
jgi:hypothetical protein